MNNKESPRKILRHITFVFFKRKLLIVILFSFTVSSFAFGTFLISPRWKATTKILVLQNPKQQMILFKDLTVPSPSLKGTSANDLVQILKSNVLAVEIVKKFKLDERRRQKAQNPKTPRDKVKRFLAKVFTSPFTLVAKFGSTEEKPPNFFATALRMFVGNMEDIKVEEGTSTINLSIWAETPELATGIANTLASMLVDTTRQFERSEAAKTYDFAQVHLKSVNEALEKKEDELLDFKERERVVDLEMEKSLNLQRLDRLTAEFEATKKNLAAMEAKLEDLQNQLSSQPERITTSEITGNNTTYERLKNTLNEAEIKLADLQKTLRQKHPDILGLKARIELNRQKLQEEERHILLNETTALNSIQRDLQQKIIDTQTSISELRSKRDSLQKTLADLRKEVDSLPREEITQERLTRSVSGLKERYLDLRKKLLELEIQKFTEISEFDLKISDPAFIPEGTKPDRPIWFLNLFVGVIIGLFVSVGLAFFQEYWSDTLKSPEDVSEVVGLKVLGAVPPFSPRKVLEQIKA
jgi:uncharacterized protein involved in exopolysaccharide biosynthesis